MVAGRSGDREATIPLGCQADSAALDHLLDGIPVGGWVAHHPLADPFLPNLKLRLHQDQSVRSGPLWSSDAKQAGSDAVK